MSKIVDALMKVLGKFDQEIKPASEADISKTIYSVRDPKDVDLLPENWAIHSVNYPGW